MIVEATSMKNEVKKKTKKRTGRVIKADPDEGTDLENGDEQDLEDEEADEGADVKERMD